MFINMTYKSCMQHLANVFSYVQWPQTQYECDVARIADSLSVLAENLQLFIIFSFYTALTPCSWSYKYTIIRAKRLVTSTNPFISSWFTWTGMVSHGCTVRERIQISTSPNLLQSSSSPKPYALECSERGRSNSRRFEMIDDFPRCSWNSICFVIEANVHDHNCTHVRYHTKYVHFRTVTGSGAIDILIVPIFQPTDRPIQ